MGIIYMATNICTNRSYIGKTIGTLTKRKNTHHYHALTRNTKTYFYNALRQYGKESFDWIILETVSDVGINEAERFWIQYFISIGAELYNLTQGGDGQSKGYKPSQDARLKQSINGKGKHTNRVYSEEYKKKLSLARKGKKHSEKTKAKMSKAYAKTYRLRDPSGSMVDITNMYQFCLQHGYSSGNFTSLMNGRQKSAYGYTKP